jgi:hypothetical protein
MHAAAQPNLHTRELQIIRFEFSAAIVTNRNVCSALRANSELVTPELCFEAA